MNIQDDDTGVIQTLLERFEKHRLPRITEIKQRLDQGNTLSDFDIEYLSEAIHDAKVLLPYLNRHPEYEALVSSVIHYYKLITDEALANEDKTLNSENNKSS